MKDNSRNFSLKQNLTLDFLFSGIFSIKPRYTHVYIDLSVKFTTTGLLNAL